MEKPSFSPKVKGEQDQIEHVLYTIAQNIAVAIFGLLPVIFLPVKYLPFEYSKTVVVIIGVLLAFMFFSLSTLRSGKLSVSAPVALVAFWGLVAVTLISTLLSGDIRDSFFGNFIEAQTSLFMLMLGLVATVIVLFGRAKTYIMRLYMLLSFSAVVLTLYHVMRILFGPEFLSFGLFTSAVSSPVGGWNQLGLFFGLVVLLALIALEQLPLTSWGKWLFTSVVALSVLMLMMVNFVAVWVVMATVSLIMLMYSLTKDRFKDMQLSSQGEGDSTSVQSVLISIFVFVISLTFIIGGSTVGTFISERTNINYVEVRPSFEATLDIGRDVLKENAFVGVGPNRFSDAWRMYKDQSINQTVFWNTNFVSGSGFIPTMFISTGMFGVIAFLAFAFFFVRAGIKMLFVAQTGDRFWYFIASSSFVASVYLWGMSFIYSTGTTMLILAAVFTGITCVAYTSIVPTKAFNFSVFSNKRAGILLVGIVMVVIVVAASSLYYTSRHYSSIASFYKAASEIVPGSSIEESERAMANAYTLHENDTYARRIAEMQIAKMNLLLSIAEPTAEQLQQFQQSAASGINAAELAIDNDSTEASNHRVLATIYGILTAAGYTEFKDQSLATIETARHFDPNNPEYYFMEAQIYSRTGEVELAREKVLKAVELKVNYTDALNLLTQLDIAAGNVEEAIAATLAITQLERNNPARFYQLGVLYVSNADYEAAAASFERAVSLDQNYANARYFLALSYIELDRIDEAVTNLEIVRDLNPENGGVQALIDQLLAGNLPASPVEEDDVVSEERLDVEEDGSVVTTEDLDSSLVAPVNVVPE